MALTVEELVLTMSADVRRMEKALDRAQGKFDKTARDIEKRQRELDKNLEKLGSAAGAGLGRLSGAAALAFGAITGYSIKAAADAVELRDAFKIAFGEGAKGAEAYAKALSDRVGRSQLEIMESMTRFRLLLKNQDRETAESMVQALQARAIDVGSLFNLKDAEVIQKFFSGLSGEAEPLKALGVNLNEAAMKAELLRLGFKGNVSEASEQAKQIARLNIILRETEVALGNASDTADSTANRFKKLQGETRDAAAAFGEQFLPIANQVLQWATEALTKFNDLPSGVQTASLALLGLVAVGGPILSVIGGLAKLITYARNAKIALAGMAAAGAGAGATGAAGGAAGLAARVAGPAGVAVSALTLSGDTARGDPKAKAQRELTNLLALQQQYYGQLQDLGDRADAKDRARLERYLATVQKGIDRRNALLFGGQTSASSTADVEKQASAAAAAASSGFGLSSSQLNPVAGGSGGRAAANKAAREAEQAAKRTLAQQERTDQLLGRADDDLLAARSDLVVEAEARLVAEIQAIDHARAARAKELDYAVKQGDLTAAQAKQVAAAEETVRLQEAANARAKRDDEVARELTLKQLASIDVEADLLGLTAGLARTAAERRDAELRLLDLAEQRERIELDAIIASAQSKDVDKEIARRKLTGLDATGEARRELARRDTAGPLERYVADTPKSIDEVNESMQRMATQGLDALASGLTDAALRAQSLGDVARNVFRQIASDLIASVVRKNITGPIAAFLGSKIPGFAGGTNFAPGGPALVGENGPELVNLPRGAQVVPNDILRSLSRIQAAPSATTIHQHITLDNRGALIWEKESARLMSYANQVATRSAYGAVQSARHMVRGDLTRRSRNALG